MNKYIRNIEMNKSVKFGVCKRRFNKYGLEIKSNGAKRSSAIQ